MSTQHTPGPWYAMDANTGGGATEIRGGSHHYPIAKASSYWQGPGPRQEEGEANARLIAAAPELLAALKLVMPILRGIDAKCTGRTAMLSTVEAAIAKAEGRA